MFSGTKQLKQLEISGLVIHKIDIGKVKTSKNVMKLLKLLLTVIVKHPVYSRHEWCIMDYNDMFDMSL